MTPVRRVASIDCGTNTIKLLIAEMPEILVQENRMVRLGQGVDRTGVLAPEALERAFAVIDEYAALIRQHGAERVRFVATSATRDAANAAVFAEGVKQRLGVDPEVVTGAEEAALSYDGAARGLDGDIAAPVMVIDIGGGSTELILGPGLDKLDHRIDHRIDHLVPEAAHSMDIGSVRLTERHLHSDPPTAQEWAACIDDIEAHLDASPVAPGTARTVIGVGGTVIQLASGLLELSAYDREALRGQALGIEEIDGIVERLKTLTVDERRALPWMHPGRADVITAGGVILARILRRTRVGSLIVSVSDILDGIAWSITD